MIVVSLPSVPTHKGATRAPVVLDIKETAECASVRTAKAFAPSLLLILGPSCCRY